ncbi:hypothetical protein FA15DRAFT_669107 [Coprinopsis marcescibilis]|uniref:G domain-containing protein n=1 Tax=Coprinopsis marcescibilis TaxID=230819 RepID=A0A5C3L9J1_COPMA|nr:hypothetical protein FA15DRAFT_669107 [Coprinopsis marcescibilis]
MGTPDLNSRDSIILVFGRTGSGKSTFINNVIDPEHEVAPTDPGFDSCTEQVGSYLVPLEHPFYQHVPKSMRSGRLFLVDTPGFDAFQGNASRAFEEVCKMLISVNDKGAQVGGMVYLCRCFPSKVGGEHLADLRVFREICGTAFLQKAVLCVTGSNLCNRKEVIENRLTGLRDKYWASLIEGGAQMKLLENTPDSANEVLITFAQSAFRRDHLPALLEQLKHDHNPQSTIPGKIIRRNWIRQLTGKTLDYMRKLLGLNRMFVKSV